MLAKHVIQECVMQYTWHGAMVQGDDQDYSEAEDGYVATREAGDPLLPLHPHLLGNDRLQLGK